MTSVLVLGGEGMLGHMVVRELSRRPGLTVRWTQHSDADKACWLEALDGLGGISRFAERHGRHDYLINCIGVLRHMIDETQPQSLHRAIAVNALFPQDLARFSQSTGARTIHVSTDSVFRGRRERYFEDDIPDGVEIYGKSKALGEPQAPGFVTIRCSLVGPDTRGRRGLLEWLRSQPDGSRLPGYTDHWWNGATTLQFAQLCARIITQGSFDRLREEGPVHHFCPNTAVTKYELLSVMKAVFHKNVLIEPASGPAGPLRLVLATRYRVLSDLYGCGIQMRNAIAELAAGC